MMNDSSVYKLLKYIKKKGAVSSDVILRCHKFHGYGENGLSCAINELFKRGFIYARKSNGVLFCQISPDGEVFVENYKYDLKLKNIERVVIFFGGLLSGYIISYVFPLLPNLLSMFEQLFQLLTQ